MLDTDDSYPAISRALSVLRSRLVIPERNQNAFKLLYNYKSQLKDRALNILNEMPLSDFRCRHIKAALKHRTKVGCKSSNFLAYKYFRLLKLFAIETQTNLKSVVWVTTQQQIWDPAKFGLLFSYNMRLKCIQRLGKEKLAILFDRFRRTRESFGVWQNYLSNYTLKRENVRDKPLCVI